MNKQLTDKEMQEIIGSQLANHVKFWIFMTILVIGVTTVLKVMNGIPSFVDSFLGIK